MKQYQSYRCNKCKNEVEVQVVGSGTLTCCGEEMEMITKSLTAVNLMKAFAGESQARNRYEFFSEMAFDEGYNKISRFFQEVAGNEKYHALAEYKAYNKLINGIELDTTIKNLQFAANGERYEHEQMYPDFEKIAIEEGHEDIARLFRAIQKVEVKHEKAYLELKKNLIKDGFFEAKQDTKWVCEVCWHTHKGEKPPGACPLCQAENEYFKNGDYIEVEN